MREPKQDEVKMLDIAYELIGDDPEPEDGWRAFDEQGRRIPRKPSASAEPEAPERPPEAKPPGRFDDDHEYLESDPEGEGLADDLDRDDTEPEGGWRDFDEQGRRIPRKAGEPQPVPKDERASGAAAAGGGRHQQVHLRRQRH